MAGAAFTGHYQHFQAMAVAIDQYAAKAIGNREYFLGQNRKSLVGVGTETHLRSSSTEEKPAHDSEQRHDGNCRKQ
jgi:hypothetical protein